MSFNIADYYNLNVYTESARSSGNKYAKSGNSSFFDVFLTNLPNKYTKSYESPFSDLMFDYMPGKGDLFADAYLNQTKEKKVTFADEARMIVGEKRFILEQLLENKRSAIEAKRF